MSKRFLLFLAISFICIIVLVGAISYPNNFEKVFLPMMVKSFGGSGTPPASTGLVEIKDIFYNGAGQSQPDEYVVIENEESFPIQLQNWTLRDDANHIFTFPDYIILPNQQCRVYTNQIHNEWCGFNYASGSAIWNDSGGDTAYLRDSNGTLIDDYSY